MVVIQRIAMGLEYDGYPFHGWQWQPELRTVQATVEQAVSKVADVPIAVHVAGRTDAGVHAKGQVIHFDTSIARTERAWRDGSNAFLPAEVVVRWAQVVDTSFHARFAATQRYYRYLLYQRDIRPTYLRHYVTWIRQSLNFQRMQEAAQHLVGEYDFSSFRASQCQAASPVRHVKFVHVKRRRDLICIDICANAFLHHMVRNIVGTLLPIGLEQQPVSWMQSVLKAKDRRAAGVTAKASGLYLMRVEYPPHRLKQQVKNSLKTGVGS